MRLLNVHTLEFGEFFDQQIPAYVILSHRWGDGEVTFKQMKYPKKREQLSGPGIDKIYDFCEVVKKRDLKSQEVYQSPTGEVEFRNTTVEWVWIDTCCIDKRSSSELSEAINSMYDWYRNSVECFVYMRDVNCPVYAQDMRNTSVATWNADRLEAFNRSAWFTRGWTLQELLAPDTVVFFDATWSVIGYMTASHPPPSHPSKLYGPHLRDTIAEITGIKSINLRKRFHIRHASIAEKMSWAARRKTSRVEDKAYCLLGLFEINMPLIYGEGMKAFQRLQEQIIRSSNDQSIFAWSTTDFQNSKIMRSPVLAPSPAAFLNSGEVIRTQRILLSDEGKKRISPAYSITNKGIKMKVNLTRVADLSRSSTTYKRISRLVGNQEGDSLVPKHVYFLRLDCEDLSTGAPVEILLAELEKDVYSRMLRQDLGARFRTLQREAVGMKRIYMQTQAGFPVQDWTEIEMLDGEARLIEELLADGKN